MANASPVELLLMQALAPKLAEFRQRERRELAVEIVNAYGESLRAK